jgi:hypothetical protein
MRLAKRLLRWLLFSVPVGAITGTILGVFGTDSGIHLRTSVVVSGAITGVGLGILGATFAMLTTTVFEGTLERTGGSRILTGVVVSGGLMALGFSVVYL